MKKSILKNNHVNCKDNSNVGLKCKNPISKKKQVKNTKTNPQIVSENEWLPQPYKSETENDVVFVTLFHRKIKKVMIKT